MEADSPPSEHHSRQTLDWPAVQDAARAAFSIWAGQPELRWARGAWDILARAGLTTYANEFERCTVALRFLSLAGIYHDFCHLAWDETDHLQYHSWAAKLHLSTFRIGQLAGANPSLAEDEDDYALIDQALRLLADEARDEVLGALLHSLGNTSGLFLFLWRSRESGPDAAEPEDADIEPETDSEILNDVTPEKAEAFAW